MRKRFASAKEELAKGVEYKIISALLHKCLVMEEDNLAKGKVSRGCNMRRFRMDIKEGTTKLKTLSAMEGFDNDFIEDQMKIFTASGCATLPRKKSTS